MDVARLMDMEASHLTVQHAEEGKRSKAAEVCAP